MKPDTMNSAPATYIGTDVARFAYSAMIGACMRVHPVSTHGGEHG